MIDSQDFLNKDVSELASVELRALWWDGHEEWHRAHDLVDGPPSQSAAWVHAYLHRKEGDIWNADYWYRRAGKKRPNCSLYSEWLDLVRHFYSD